MNIAIGSLLNLLYPKERKCCICGAKTRNIICAACIECVPYLNGIVCLKCGKRLNEAYPSNICPDCRSTDYCFDAAYACFEYKGLGKELIHRFKYEGRTEAAAFIAKQMANTVQNENICIDAIVPVPVHEKKLGIRGFNQSYLIGEQLSRLIDKPLLDCVERVRETKNQYNLDREQRFLNIAGAFSIKLMYNISKYNRLLLVDDIFTTGSTANECSRLLKAHGACYVCVITAATGSNT